MPAFAPPGPGEWSLDRSHYPGGTTPIVQALIRQGFEGGFGRVFAEIGVPAERMDAAFVHGFMYTRLRPLIGADKPPRRPPPTPVLWAASRLHPAFRARTKAATATLRDRPSTAVVERWTTEIRPNLMAKNFGFQDVDPAAIDDAALQQHVDELLDHLASTYRLHFWLHGHDLGPIARYLYESIKWGLQPSAAIAALTGASPSTARPIGTLCELRSMIEASGSTVHSLDDVRAVSGEIRLLLDDYLRDHAHVLTTGYDLTALTLGELPDLVLSSIMTATPPPTVDEQAIAADLRAEVPVAHREEFDRLLADARHVMDMRDDNGPQTVEWPTGLLRRALLAAGTRLADRGALATAEHVFELTPLEAGSLFAGVRPPADELAARAAERAEWSTMTPPATLGDPEPEPPLHALPKALVELIAMVQVSLKYMGMDGTTIGDPMAGTGIGASSYIGRACVASSADEAIERLEPGDVLVVRATSPAFNAVLMIAGAVVTADGGPMSHAAVLARELGIAAVIGASGALSIPDGSTVEVDPVAGAVQVVAVG
jgi:pyruvate,water dikinase